MRKPESKLALAFLKTLTPERVLARFYGETLDLFVPYSVRSDPAKLTAIDDFMATLGRRYPLRMAAQGVTGRIVGPFYRVSETYEERDGTFRPAVNILGYRFGAEPLCACGKRQNSDHRPIAAYGGWCCPDAIGTAREG